MQTVYLDYNATTPLDAKVRESMLPYLESAWGNPSSIHHVGRHARALLDEQRDRLASILRCKPSEVVFTSGGTESANAAVFGAAHLLQAKGKHVITSTVEHHAVLHSFQRLAKREGFEVTFLPVDREGRVSPDTLLKAIRPDTTFVSLMAANNETGTIQPVEELGAICRQRGIIFHTDAVQWFGKEPFTDIHQFNADLVSICAHKIHGPKGVGALFTRSPLQPEPLLVGGGHENERRAGTENLPAIAGFVEAASLFVREPVFPPATMSLLSERLVRLVDTLDEAIFVGSREHRLKNTVSFLVKGSDSIAVLAGLDLEGVCASGGAACSAGSLEPSHVISAIGYPKELAHSLIRFSLGRENSSGEIDFVEEVLPEVLARARQG